MKAAFFSDYLRGTVSREDFILSLSDEWFPRVRHGVILVADAQLGALLSVVLRRSSYLSPTS